jgi:hypothetical protein
VAVSLAGNLTVTHALNLTQGALNVNTATINLSGDSFVQSSGTLFSAGSGTLSGNCNITGLNVTSGLLTLSGGHTYTITAGSGNGITLGSSAGINFNGTSDNALVTLVSSSPGTYWYLNNVSGSSVTANYVNVADSDATTNVTAANSINSGHNVNWTFTTNSRLWLGTTSSAWNTAANWSGNTVPLSTDIVTFDGSYNNPIQIPFRLMPIP